MNKWRRYKRLSRSDQTALLWALLLVPVTAAGLRVFGFRRWKSVLAFTAPRNSDTPVASSKSLTTQLMESTQRTGRMVAAASREGISHGRCLEQSLVLWWLLLWRRLPAELHIGVRQADAGFEAHAWVELLGIVVNDSDGVHQEYVPFGRDITKLGIQSH